MPSKGSSTVLISSYTREVVGIEGLEATMRYLARISEITRESAFNLASAIASVARKEADDTIFNTKSSVINGGRTLQYGKDSGRRAKGDTSGVYRGGKGLWKTSKRGGYITQFSLSKFGTDGATAKLTSGTAATWDAVATYTKPWGRNGGPWSPSRARPALKLMDQLADIAQQSVSKAVDQWNATTQQKIDRVEWKEV